MRKLLGILAAALVALAIGFAAGWWIGDSRSTARLDSVVAMSWGDGKYGPAFYGAHVFLEPRETGYSVQARVYIGRGYGAYHDCGELGRVQTDAEAVARWGRIEWRDDGLHIGTSPGAYFLPRAELENHR